MRGAILEHPLREDYEFYVADNGDTAEGDRGCPERGVVSYAAGDRWEVRVCGWEKVEGYMRGKDFRR